MTDDKTIYGLRMVAEFYRRVGKPIRTRPTGSIPSGEVNQLMRLLREEVDELTVAVEAKDVVGIADGLGDIVYVVYGAALQYGIDLDRVLVAIHEANMTKPNADGSIMRARDGKIMRGDSYLEPALREALGLEGEGN
jgi:predicted HAD superfamily Cof-like phosphohydrolase